MRVPIRVVWALLFSAFSVAGAGFPLSKVLQLPDMDRRPSVGEALEGGPRQRLATSALQRRDPGVQVVFDARLGTPRLITSSQGFLGDATGGGRALGLAGPVAPAAGAVEPWRPLHTFVRSHADLFGHDDAVFGEARLERDDVTPRSGLRTVVWEQQLDGIRVFEGRFVGHLTRGGEIVRISSRFVPGIADAADRGHPNRAAVLAQPPISAEEAVALVAANLGENDDRSRIRPVDAAPEGSGRRQRFETEAARGLAHVELAWVPFSRTVVRLAWRVEFASRSRGGWYRVLVDAETGEVLVRHCLTYEIRDASYRVFTGDSPSPFSPGLVEPGPSQPAVVPRSLVTLGALSTNASPAGWIDDGVNELRGNNVDARLDRDDDDQADLPRLQGSPFRVFDLPLALDRAPATYGGASVTHLFYWNNWMHDRLYDLGFTEASGNFQRTNFNRGGLGNDAVIADAQDGGGFNNANFSAPSDGIPGRMQMYVFDGPNPDRDGTLDTEVILHEYTHGLTSRLVGGGAGITALQSQGLGEGWSDFYALALLSESGDDIDGNYPFGGYSAHRMERLDQNYYFGIRRYPYSTDLQRNPLTFRDIDPAQAADHERVPRNPIFARLNLPAEVHNQGELWCSALWEARANLISELGFEAGNARILALVTDGLKLTPENPSFLEARDAILQADRVLTGGAHREALWLAFAKRGMGFSARAPGSNTTDGVVEAFDVPDELLLTPANPLLTTGPESGPFTPIEHVLTLSNEGTNRVVWTASKSALWFDLSAGAGEIAAGGASAELVVRLNEIAGLLTPGIYRDLIVFTNHTTTRVQSRAMELRVGQGDALTQRVTEDVGSLEHHVLTFTPDGSSDFYSVCREAVQDFPVDPSSGVLLTFAEAPTESITLRDGAQVSLFGAKYGTLHISQSGYVTFLRPVADFSGSLIGHFAEPRVSLLVNPYGFYFGGFVSWAQLSDRVAVTYEGLVDVLTFETTSMQLELFFDGRVRLTHLDVGEEGGILGLSRGNGLPSGFVDSRFDAVGPCLPGLVLEVPVQTREGGGAAEGRVSVGTPPAQDVVVRLRSTRPDLITLPESVTIVSGQTAATFEMAIVDNRVIEGSRSVRILALAEGFREASGRMEIVDDEQGGLALSLPSGLREGDGTRSGAGRVFLRTPARRPIVVLLRSANPEEVTVSASVIIPAGELGAPFDLTVVDDTRIDGTVVTRVIAEISNWAPATAGVAVEDNEDRGLRLRLVEQAGENQGAVAGGGVVSLAGTLTADLRVALRSSVADDLLTPPSAVIRAGETQAVFDLELRDNARIDGARTVRVQASAETFASAVASMRVLDDETPPIPAGPRPADRSTNNSPATRLTWMTGTGELIVNGDFERGDLSGWREQNSGSGGFAINDGFLDPAGPESPAPVNSGQFEAWSQQTGPGRFVLSQEITLADGATAADFAWDQRIHNHASAFTGEEQAYRVEIRSTEDEVLAVAFTTRPGDPSDSGWTHHTFRLTPFIGRTIRVAFVTDVNLGYLNVRLDNVSVHLGPDPGTTYDVYFGLTPTLGPESFRGTTSTNLWEPPPLDPATTYYWRVISRWGAAFSFGPVWQFAVPAVGAHDHFGWAPIASPQPLGEPIPVRLMAQDVHGNTVPEVNTEVQVGARIQYPDATLGTGTVPWEMPFGGFGSDSRIQVIYPPEEVGRARLLTSLAVNVAVPRTSPAVRFTLRLKHASLRSYGTRPAWERTGWTTVYRKDEPLVDPGWVTFEFSTPFEYDGVSPLMIDFSYRGADFNFGGDCRSTLVPEPRAIWYQGFGFDGDPLSWSGTASPEPTRASQVPNVRLSGRRDVPLKVAASVPVRAGEWNGVVQFDEFAQGIRLTARDSEGRTGVGEPFDLEIRDDLSVTGEESLKLLTVGDVLPLKYVIRNAGPGVATGVFLTNRLPAGLELVSARASTGTVVSATNPWVVSIGTLGAGITAEVHLELKAPALVANIATNHLDVVRAEVDRYPANNRLDTPIRIAPVPRLIVEDLIVDEGDAGESNRVYWVRISEPSSREVTLRFASEGGTAAVNVDYEPVSGTLRFPPGTIQQPIALLLRGDSVDEAQETFGIRFSEVVGATVTRTLGLVSIRDDDGPTIRVLDTSVREGNTGRTNALFEVLLSAASPQAITVDYETSDATAVSPGDYESVFDSLRFSAGVTQQWVRVPVNGDRLIEGSERFFLELSSPTNATLANRQASAVILNDDGLPGDLHHFDLAPVDAEQLMNVPFPITVLARDTQGQPATNYAGSPQLIGEVVYPDGEVGSGNSSSTDPLSTFYEDVRTQIIYRAEELGGARVITGIALSITNPPSLTLNRWTIRVKPTALRSYGANPVWERVGWTTVHQSNRQLRTSGWTEFSFNVPYNYDGRSNLLVDLSFNNRESDFQFLDPECLATDTPDDRALVGKSDSFDGDPLSWTGRTPLPDVQRMILDLRLISHVPVPTEPARAVGFTQGAWTGDVVVRQPAQGMSLRVVDDEGPAASSALFDVTVENDLVVSATATPDPVTVSQPIHYTVALRNSGPDDILDISVTNDLPAGARFVSAEGPAGACEVVDGQVVCRVAKLAGGARIEFEQVLLAPEAPGRTTNVFRAGRSGADPYPANDRVEVVARVNPVPSLNIFDAQVNEGDEGDVDMTFRVGLSTVSSQAITVDYRTEGVSASVGADFAETQGTLTVAAGTTNGVIVVPVHGDRIDEVQESLALLLSNPVNVVLSKVRATGVIVDDDGPEVVIAPVSVREGQTGVTEAMFQIRLTEPSVQPVLLSMVTRDDSAIAGEDYFAVTNSLTLAPGRTDASVRVFVRGDLRIEPDERFELEVLSVVNARVATNRIEALVLNDDGLPGELDHFDWAPIPSPHLLAEPVPVTLSARDAAGQSVDGFNGSVSISAMVTLPDVEIGTAEFDWELPFDTTSEAVRLQAIYPASEVGRARRLTSLALNVTQVPDHELRRWTLRLRHTPLLNYGGAPVWESSAWFTVYRADERIEEAGWRTFVFQQPFNFNGTNSLMVDFSFENDDSTFFEYGQCSATSTPRFRSIWAGSDRFSGSGPLTWSGRLPTPTPELQVPDVRFSAHIPVDVLPNTVDSFLNGKWTGTVTLGRAGSNLVLRAVDDVGHTGVSAPFDVVSVVDMDQDGMPDDWEIRSGLDPRDARDAEADADGDGVSNLHEYLTGTDPRAPGSVLRLSIATPPSGGVALRIASVTGRLYRLETTTDLASGPWISAGAQDFPGTGAEIQWVVNAPADGADGVFYRILVLPAAAP